MLDPRWFLVPRPRPGARLRLFCFAHAGGGAAVYRAWPDLVGADIEVAAIRLPGRESRFAEPCFRSMTDAVEALCDALEPGLDKPFAFFGHSLGALLAHATARALRDVGRPVHLFAAASGAPGHGTSEPLHTLPADALVERLRAYGGMPDPVLRQDALIGVLLPTIRADLELAHAYRPAPGLLTCPVTVLGGTRDRTLGPGGLGAWRAVTEGDFRMRLVPGGHFFVSDQAERTTAEVMAALGASRVSGECAFPAHGRANTFRLRASPSASLASKVRAMADETASFDYHGALVVVETGADEIVMIHPPGGPAEAPASLPSDPCAPGEDPRDGAVRIVREKTGLEVEIVREFVTFIQEGTPTGTMRAHGYIARVVGGSLTEDGPEGPARAYPLDDCPPIIPIRIANQRTLRAYLEQR